MASAFALIPGVDALAAGIAMDTIPSVRLEQGWESNVNNSSTNEVSSLYFRAIPGLAVKFTTSDQVELKVEGNYEQVWYYDTDARTADYKTYYIRVDSTGEVMLTPTLSMVPSVHYVNTINSSRRIQLLPSDDQVAPPATIINYGNTKTEDFGGGATFRYAATPNLSIALTGIYRANRFEDPQAESGLTDSTTTTARAGVSYRFSPRTRLGVGISGNHNTFEEEPDSNVLSVGLTFDHQFTPSFSLEGVLGVSRVIQKAAPGTAEQDDYRPSGAIRAAYVSDTVRSVAFVSGLYTGGSGFGETTRQGTAGLSFSGPLSAAWSWRLNGTYQITTSVFTDSIDLSSAYGTAGVAYRFFGWGSLELTGHVDRQWNNGQFGEDLTNYSALLGVTIGKSYNIF